MSTYLLLYGVHVYYFIFLSPFYGSLVFTPLGSSSMRPIIQINKLPLNFTSTLSYQSKILLFSDINLENFIIFISIIYSVFSSRIDFLIFQPRFIMPINQKWIHYIIFDRTNEKIKSRITSQVLFLSKLLTTCTTFTVRYIESKFR